MSSLISSKLKVENHIDEYDPDNPPMGEDELAELHEIAELRRKSKISRMNKISA